MSDGSSFPTTYLPYSDSQLFSHVPGLNCCDMENMMTLWIGFTRFVGELRTNWVFFLSVEDTMTLFLNYWLFETDWCERKETGLHLDMSVCSSNSILPNRWSLSFIKIFSQLLDFLCSLIFARSVRNVRLIDNTLNQIVILFVNDFTGIWTLIYLYDVFFFSRKLPDNLAFQNITSNLGTFRMFPFAPKFSRVDIARPLIGVKPSQLTTYPSSVLMLLTPDNSILTCGHIALHSAKKFLRTYNYMLYGLFFDETAQELMRPMVMSCLRKNGLSQLLKWSP